MWQLDSKKSPDSKITDIPMFLRTKVPFHHNSLQNLFSQCEWTEHVPQQVFRPSCDQLLSCIHSHGANVGSMYSSEYSWT
jgi:hypothetical protein